MNAWTRSRRRPNLVGTVRLEVEFMESRLLPGEALSALLLPLGMTSLRDLLDPQADSRDQTSDIQIVDDSAARPGALAASADDLAAAGAGLSAPFAPADGPLSGPGGGQAAVLPVAAGPAFGSGGLTPGDVALGMGLFSPFAAARPAGPAAAPAFAAPAAVGSAPAAPLASPLTIAGSSGALEAAVPAAALAPAADGGQAAALAGNAGGAEPMLHAAPFKGPHGGGGPTAGYFPAQMRHAYGFDQLSADGTGQTIAIVDAFDDPNITSDLNTFSSQFGLPTTTSGGFTFNKVYAQGSKPAGNASWGQEISLDVEWAHAIAPHATITLVETADNSFTNLLGGVDYATSHGAQVVSMSWGANDFAGESANDFHFNIPGVTFVASAGDTGAVVEWPAASPFVVAVGGTTLPLDSSGNRTGAETAWNSGGGGVSGNEALPGYQAAYGLTYSGRANPDVAYNANPNTGVAVFDSYAFLFQNGWLVFGGTSAGAPQWAGLMALANQGRTSPLSSNNPTSSPVYNAATGSAYASNYRDITSGSNGFPAGPGYDLATGVGSPQANNLVPYLASH
jgi:hypothetical protein